MKTTVRQLPYSEVQALPLPPHRAPRKPGIALRTLIYGLSGFALAGTGFRCETNELSKIPKEQPCLIFMNHSCFLSLSSSFLFLFPVLSFPFPSRPRLPLPALAITAKGPKAPNVLCASGAK